jgi:S1-C subfamily serine protease
MRIALLGLVLSGCGNVADVWDRVVVEPAPPRPVLTSTVPAVAPSPTVLPAVAPSPRGASLIGLAEVLPEVSEGAVRSVVSVANPHTLSGGQGLGSGVVVSADGIIVTNHHVIEGSDQVIVALNTGEQQRATVVGTDPKTDLAVLRLSDPPDDLVPLAFGDSDDLRLGEVVLAVGTPFGIGQTVTMGIVSAKGRADMGIVDYEDFIQTDAAINPGNSGGALVDLDGTLVGINTAIFSRTGGSQGIGFAIPASMARPIVDAILAEGEVDRGFLGVQIRDLPFDDREALGLAGGALIAGVQAGTPAAAAGLQAGDVVVEYMGQPVPDAARFRNRVAATGSDRPFEAVVLREGRREVVKGMLTAL